MTYLISNSVDPTTVREEQRGGDTYLVVENVPFVRAMSLSGGYVPRDEIKQSTNRWDGVPLTANHPRDENGKPVPAQTKLNEVGVGRAENPRFDGTWIRANLAINADRAKAMGGTAADIVTKIQNGEKFDVSSQYVPKPLPAGEYDGEHRANVEGIAEPDSIALLPHKPGVCSVEDGCGINPQMVANAAVQVPMTQNATHGEDMGAAAQHFSKGDLVEWQTGDATAQGRVIKAFTEPGTSVTRTFDGTEVTRKVTENEGVYLVEAWDGDEFNSDKRALKSGSNVSTWANPPEAVMRANQDVEYDISDVFDATEYDQNDYTDDEWNASAVTDSLPNPSESEDAPGILDDTHALIPQGDEARDNKSNWKAPFRASPDGPVNTRALVAIKAAASGARGGFENVDPSLLNELENRADEMLAEAPAELFGAGDDMESNSLFDKFMLWATGGQSHQTENSSETGGAESPAEDSYAGMNRDELISDIVEHSLLTENALAARCDDGLKAIHKDVMANAKGEEGEDTGDEARSLIEKLMDAGMTQSEIGGRVDRDADTISAIVNGEIENPPMSLVKSLREIDVPDNNDNMSDNTDTDTDDAITFDSREEFDEYIQKRAEELVANREEKREKEQLATDIVANSAEYEDTEAVLEDYPTKAALQTKRESVTSGGALPGSGVTGNGVEQTDNSFDVSSGVLTE